MSKKKKKGNPAKNMKLKVERRENKISSKKYKHELKQSVMKNKGLKEKKKGKSILTEQKDKEKEPKKKAAKTSFQELKLLNIQLIPQMNHLLRGFKLRGSNWRFRLRGSFWTINWQLYKSSILLLQTKTI